MNNTPLLDNFALCNLVRRLACCILAFAAILCTARPARAQYYDDDYITLPTGPIELEHAVASYNSTLRQWTLSGDAVNLSSQTYNNVKYLDEWVFDYIPQPSGPAVTDAFSYQGAALWSSTDGNTWSVLNPDGFLLANQVSPLPYSDTPQAFSAPPAYVAPDDLLPYINIGTLAPGASAPFSQTISVSGHYLFAFDSSFISTGQPVSPVPEPSTLVLFGVAMLVAGMLGAGMLGRRRSAALAAAKQSVNQSAANHSAANQSAANCPAAG